MLLDTTKTPQTEHFPGTQVENSAKGYAWQLDDWQRVDRFLQALLASPQKLVPAAG